MSRAAAPGAVVDVGGSGIATWRLAASSVEPFLNWEGCATPAEVGELAREAASVGTGLLLATPGVMDNRGLVHASNLGWAGVDLGQAVGLPDHDVRWVNDAVAIAAGERALHGLTGNALVLTFGTGLGVAVADESGARPLMVSDDREYGHMDTGADLACPCGRRGCAEAVGRRWLDAGIGGEVLVAAVDVMLRVARADSLVLCGGALRGGDNQQRALDLFGSRDGLRVLLSAAGNQKSAAPHGAADLWEQARCLA